MPSKTLGDERTSRPLGAQGAGRGGLGEQRDGGDAAAGRGDNAVTYRIGSRSYEFIGDRDTVIRTFINAVRHGYFVDLPTPAIVACLDAIEAAFDAGTIPVVDTGSGPYAASDSNASTNTDRSAVS